MFKVRRGDAPADLAVSGMPANLRGGKLATPMTDKGPSKDNTGCKSSPRADLTAKLAMPKEARHNLTGSMAMGMPKTDE